LLNQIALIVDSGPNGRVFCRNCSQSFYTP
jgi:hypothetical protein